MARLAFPSMPWSAPLRVVGLIVLVLALSVVGGACRRGTGTTPTGSGSVRITMKATEYAFAPNVIRVAPGTQVTIQLTNVGQIEHDFTFEEADLEVAVELGETVEFTFTAPSQPGTYEFFCGVSGHKDLGMVGNVMVE